MRRARQTAELFGRVAKQENNAVGQRELGTAYSAIAALLMMDGRFAESLEYSRKQLQLLEPIVAADPGNTEYTMDLPTTRAAIGYSLSWTGHAKEGVDLLRRAVTEIAKLNTSNPNTETRVNLGGIEILLGSALERKKDWDGALDAYTSALEPFHSLAESDPSDLNDGLKSARVSTPAMPFQRYAS